MKHSIAYTNIMDLANTIYNDELEGELDNAEEYAWAKPDPNTVKEEAINSIEDYIQDEDITFINELTHDEAVELKAYNADYDTLETVLSTVIFDNANKWYPEYLKK